MRDYYFFTDPTKLKTQNDDQKYGPINSVNTPTLDKFRTTNLHSTLETNTKAPAIAVCSGTICVQSIDNETFNIILKPFYQPSFRLPYIKYFIYKGIKKSSLIKSTTSPNEIIDSGDIPFIGAIRKNWDEKVVGNVKNNPITNSAKVMGLAFAQNVTGKLAAFGSDIFHDNKPLDNFFCFPNANFTLPIVNSGDKIGEFSNEFGFEIVLERLGYEPKIKLARSKSNIIELKTIKDPLNATGIWTRPKGQSSEFLYHWQLKEEACNFMDPCAFFGSFGANNLNYVELTNNRLKPFKKITYDQLYDVIISKVFANKNRLYLRLTDGHLHSYLLWRYIRVLAITGVTINQNWPDVYIETEGSGILDTTNQIAIPSLKSRHYFYATQQKKGQPYLLNFVEKNQAQGMIHVPLLLDSDNNSNCSTFVEICLEADDDFLSSEVDSILSSEVDSIFYRYLNISSIKYRNGFAISDTVVSNFGLFPFAQPVVRRIDNSFVICQIGYVLGENDIYIVTYPLTGDGKLIRSLLTIMRDYAKEPLSYFLQKTNIKSYRIAIKDITYLDGSPAKPNNLKVNIIGKDFPYSSALYHEWYNIVAIDRNNYLRVFDENSFEQYVCVDLVEDSGIDHNEYLITSKNVLERTAGELARENGLLSLRAFEAKEPKK